MFAQRTRLSLYRFARSADLPNANAATLAIERLCWAFFAAYEWPSDFSDDELLALNLESSAKDMN